MYAQDLNVTFTYGGVSQVYKCDFVTMGIEPLGEVLEKIDFSLEENYFGGRMSFRLRVRLDLMGADFMANFIIATDKTLTIDSTIYNVANDSRKVEMPFFSGAQNAGVIAELKFLRKETGILQGNYTIGSFQFG